MFVESALCDGWMWRHTSVQCWSDDGAHHSVLTSMIWLSLCCFRWIPAVLMLCFSCFCMSWSFQHGCFVFAHVGDDEWWRRQSQVLLLLLNTCYQHPLRNIHTNLNLSRYSHPHVHLSLYYVLKWKYHKRCEIFLKQNQLFAEDCVWTEHWRVNEIKTMRVFQKMFNNYPVYFLFVFARKRAA